MGERTMSVTRSAFKARKIKRISCRLESAKGTLQYSRLNDWTTRESHSVCSELLCWWVRIKISSAKILLGKRTNTWRRQPLLDKSILMVIEIILLVSSVIFSSGCMFVGWLKLTQYNIGQMISTMSCLSWFEGKMSLERWSMRCRVRDDRMCL